MIKTLFGILGICVAATAALAQEEGQRSLSDPAARPLFLAIVSAGLPPYTVTQLGPFKDLAACQAAVAVAKKARVVGDAVCVPDRTG